MNYPRHHPNPFPKGEGIRDAFVAIKDEQIVGFANYGKEHSGDSEFLGELFAICVLKHFQGQGVGRELVRRGARGISAGGRGERLRGGKDLRGKVRRRLGMRRVKGLGLMRDEFAYPVFL